MNDITIAIILMALISGLTIVLLLLFRKQSRFEIFNDSIVIHDFGYPANIPNYTIKSISMIEQMPKVMLKSNGYGGLKIQKGIFKIQGGRRAALYVEDHRRGPFINIQTMRDNVYINLRDENQTHRLYDEMTKTIKILNEAELVDCKVVTTGRSWLVVAVFTAITILLSMLPILFI